MYTLENDQVTQSTPQPLANSLKTAALRLDCSVPYLRKKIQEGSLKATRFGRAIRILERDLIAFTERKED